MFFVYNAGFSQFGISLYTQHNQFLPPVPPAPLLPNVPWVFEGPAFLGSPPGIFKHKKAMTVLVDGGPGIQEGHDVGFLIPHFASPMNAMCVVNTLFSKHKIVFPVSSVLLEGKPVGTNPFGLLDMICCDPFALPVGATIPISGTVFSSMSAGDFASGLLTIFVDIVLDLIWNKIKGPLKALDPTDKLKALLGTLFPVIGQLTMRELLRLSSRLVLVWFDMYFRYKVLSSVVKDLFKTIAKTLGKWAIEGATRPRKDNKVYF